MLHCMDEPRILTRKMYVRSHANSRNALKQLLLNAQQSGLEFEGAEVTQEAFVNASWVLLERMGKEWVAEKLRPILAEMDSWPPSTPQPTGEQSSVVDLGDPAKADDRPPDGDAKPARKRRRKP